MPDPTFSTEGPVCPGCGLRFLCDEAFYYNESGYELECDECNARLVVQPFCSWSWTTRMKEKTGGNQE